tara:strand:+ start:773 stop:1456 length:684 start_codon:yes stop_codon:yes gene_type:complete
MAQLNEKLKKLLSEVGEKVDMSDDKNSAVWSLPQNKNVLIIKHKALEKISAHLGMWFDPPTILESDTDKKIVSLVVKGYIDDGKGKNTAWSIGEVSPDNYKTYAKQSTYPYAMAEKRAVDRVILKLLGVHGDMYSEEEAEDFKTNDAKVVSVEKLDASALEFVTEAIKVFLPSKKTIKDVGDFYTSNKKLLEPIKDNQPNDFEPIKKMFADRIKEIKETQNKGENNE